MSRERTHELLADRATVGLDADQTAELERLVGAGRDDSFELAAAAATVAFLELEPPPELLERRLQASADAVFAGRIVSGGGAAPARRAWVPWTIAVAAAAAAAIILVVSAGDERVASVDANGAREAFVGQPDARVMRWTATEDPAARSAAGDVVWSDQLGTGFMRIRGLAANDPTRLQYQLWIFDPNRDDRYPVDGGVFDMPAGADDVVVPIDPRVPVRGPTLFAVTVERPGGVVVSSRERIVLTAQPL